MPKTDLFKDIMYDIILLAQLFCMAYIGITLSVHISRKHNSSSIDGLILIKPYTLVVYDLSKISREIILVQDSGIFVIRHTVLIL